MPSIDISRHPGRAAIAAGSLYTCTAALELVRPQATVFARPTDYVIEVLFIAALLCTLAGYRTIHQLHRGRAGQLERTGFWLSMLGTTGLTVSAVATLFAGGDTLGPVFLGGVLLAFVGNLGFGGALLRARVLPAWCGVLLMLALPASVVLEAVGGGLVLGLIWLALGFGLARPASRPAPEPASATLGSGRA